MAVIRLLGRFLQLTALLALPSAIWAGEWGHNERAAIGIFLGSLAIFFVGYFLNSIGKKSA